MANNKKIVSVLSTAALAGLITTALGTTAFAKTTDVVVKSGTNDYSYNLQSLTGAYDDYQMDSTKGVLYQDYLTKLKNGSVEALKDDVTGFVDYSKVQAAFENAQIVGTAFDLNAYTSTSKDVITPSNPISDVAVDAKGNITTTPEVKNLAVASVTATNSTTLKVTFNKPVSSLKPINFVVKDANGNQVYVDTVTSETTDPNSVDVVLYDSLTSSTAYTVTTQNVTAVDGSTLATQDTSVTYTKAKPAAIKFNTTTIPSGPAVDLKKYITITDANGNDITPDYANDVQFVASKTLIDGVSKVSVSAGDVVYVTAAIADNTSIVTPQVKLTVADSVATTVNTFRLTDGNAADKDVATLYLNKKIYASDGTQFTTGAPTLQATFKDQYGADFLTGSVNPTGTVFTSLSPTVVSVDQTSGEITPITAGTAYVKVTNGTASKTIQVTVKANPVATTVTPDVAAVSVSKGFDKTVNLTLKDQYGNTLANGNLVSAISDNTGVATATISDANSVDIVGIGSGTANVTVKYVDENGNFASLTLPVTVIQAGDVTGYKVVTVDNDGKIDTNTDPSNTNVNAEYKVYAVDANGNYKEDVTGEMTFTTETTGTTSGLKLLPPVKVSDSTAVSPNGATEEFYFDSSTSNVNVGTDLVTVKAAGGLTVGTISISVINTSNPIASITANASAVEIPANLDVKAAVYAKLSAKYKDGTAVSSSDLTGKINGEVAHVYSSNHAVLDDNSYVVKGIGTTTLTYTFNDNIAPISIQVNVGNLAVQGIAQNILGTNNGTVVANGTTLTATLSSAGKTALVNSVLNKDNIFAAITADGTYAKYANFAKPSKIVVTFNGIEYDLLSTADAPSLKLALAQAIKGSKATLADYDNITLGDLANKGLTATLSFGGSSYTLVVK